MTRRALFALALTMLHADARGQPLVEITGSLGLGQAAGSPASFQLTAGVAAGDIDGDGFVDIVSIGGGVLQYRRGRAGGFASPTELGGLDRQRVYEGLTLADLDGDGDLDLFVCGKGRSHLFLFDGTRFHDVTATHLPPLIGHAMSALPVDLDGDGDLDLVVSQYVDVASFPFHRCAANVVFDNDGAGRFVDRTAAAGFDTAPGCTFVTVAHDIDRDGLLEMLEVNDFAQTAAPHALRVQTGRGDDGWPVYQETGAELGFDAPTYGMGIAIGDVDGDGDDEYVITNIGQPVALTFAQGAGRFLPFDALPVRFSSEDLVATWTATFSDLDLDGHADLLLAGSTLGASNLVANTDPPESPALSRESGAWSAWEAGGSIAPARDVIHVDLDGNGLPELLSVDRTGIVRAWRRPRSGTMPFFVRLRPTLTASAWGARAVVRCGDTERSFAAIGGAHYGQTAEAVLELAVPTDCAATTVTADVHWPSGWREPVTLERGVQVVVAEPAWQVLDGGTDTLVIPADFLARLEVDPTSVEAVGGGLRPGSPELTAAGDLRVPFERLRAGSPLHLEADPWIGLRFASAPVRSIHRVARRTETGSDAPRIWLGGTPLVAGVAVNGWVSADLPLERQTVSGLEPVASVRAEGGRAFVLVPGAEDIALSVGDTRVLIPASPDHAISRSLLMASEHVFTQPLAGTRAARVRLRLEDAAGRPADIAAARLDLVARVSGRTFGAPVSSGAGWYTWELPRAELDSGDPLVAMVDGVEAPGSVRPMRVTSPSGVGALVSIEHSRCSLSEPWLDAGVGDRGVLLATFRDADGHGLPLLGLTPAWTQGGGVAPIIGAGQTASGHLHSPVVTTLGASGGAAPAVRAGNMASPLPCRAPTRPSMSEPFSAALTPVRRVDAGPAEVDAVVGLVAVPTSPAGRAIGPGLQLEVRPCGGAESLPADVAIPPLYEGGGRYAFSIVPRVPGRLCVGVGLAGFTETPARAFIMVHEAAFEPGPEPGPEAVETPGELAPESDAGTTAEWDADATIASDAERDPDTDPMVGLHDVVDPEAAGAEPEASEVQSSEFRAESGSPVKAGSDDGCASGGRSLSFWAVSAMLFWRRHRSREASMRVCT